DLWRDAVHTVDPPAHGGSAAAADAQSRFDNGNRFLVRLRKSGALRLRLPPDLRSDSECLSPRDPLSGKATPSRQLVPADENRNIAMIFSTLAEARNPQTVLMDETSDRPARDRVRAWSGRLTEHHVTFLQTCRRL